MKHTRSTQGGIYDLDFSETGAIAGKAFRFELLKGELAVHADSLVRDDRAIRQLCQWIASMGEAPSEPVQPAATKSSIGMLIDAFNAFLSVNSKSSVLWLYIDEHNGVKLLGDIIQREVNDRYRVLRLMNYSAFNI